MDETQTQSDMSTSGEPASQPIPPVEPIEEKKSSTPVYAVLAVVAIAALIGVVVYLQNPSAPADENAIDPEKVVAVVNGTDIIGADLTTSINQIQATAQLQGIDTTDPGVQTEIQAQAVEMLVNTELLEQAAAERNIEISDAAVEERIEALVTEIGSEDALEERMDSLGIDDDTLRRDVRSELMIQALLDEVFAEELVETTEEEVVEFYESVTGGGEDAPALEDIRPQLEAQIQASKEQQIVDEFITELRTSADVEIAE